MTEIITAREKLIDLLRKAINLHDGICRVVGKRKTEEIADYLIAHGVTTGVQFDPDDFMGEYEEENA